MLADHTRTSIRLVLTPERVVAAETRRTLTALALHGLRVDGIVVNRVVPGPPPSLRGPAARWLRERHSEQQAVLGELTGLGGVPLSTVDHTAAEPTGVAALLEVADNLYGADRPGGRGRGGRRRRCGCGARGGRARRRTRSSSWRCALPGAADGPLELTRVGDELVVAVGGVRRLVALPSVLRRCTVTAARLDGDDLCVAFAPDPAVWTR